METCQFVTPASGNNYQFPVDDATRANTVATDNLKANPLAGVSYVVASFGPKPDTDMGLNFSENDTAYNAGAWYIVPDANPVAGKYEIKLFFNGFTGLADNSLVFFAGPEHLLIN